MKLPKLSKRQTRKLRKLVATCVTFAVLATASGTVHAEPITLTIAEVLMYVIGYDAAMAAAAAIVSFAVSSALSYAVSAITKPSQGGYSANALSDRTHMVRSSVAPRRIVYGRCMVSGPLAFIGVSDIKDGSDQGTGNVISGGKNGFLHMVIMLAAHEIDAVEEVYFNDTPIGFLTAQNGYTVSPPFGGVTNSSTQVDVISLAANQTTFGLQRYCQPGSLFLVEGGLPPSTATGGGEYAGNDAYGNQVLAGGGSAGTQISATLAGNNATVTVAAKSYARTLYANYTAIGEAASYAVVVANLGGPDQIAEPRLIAHMPDKWTSAHRLRGIAYLYVRLRFDPKIFPNGVPNVKALIRGKKVRDPRNGGFPNDTPTYSNNYVRCMLDYLMLPDGLGCTTSDLDLTQIRVAANTCDEDVTIRAATGNQNGYTLAASQKRYTADGVVLLDHDPETNMRELSTAGGGPVPLLVGGIFQIPVGFYPTPHARPLTESDLRDTVRVRPRVSRRDLFNAVGGTYVDGRVSWQPTDFPTVANSFYQGQDGGEQLKRDVSFPFTTDEIMAQRLAKILLERSRQAITVEFPGKTSCFQYAINDVVPVRLKKFGWGYNSAGNLDSSKDKAFRVTGWSMNSNSSVDLILQEDATGVYDWNYGIATTTDLSPDTFLPAPNFISPIGAVTLTSSDFDMVRLGDGTVITRLHAFWPAHPDADVRGSGYIEVIYKKYNEDKWTYWERLSGAATECFISPVVEKELYIVGVRAFNARGISSEYSFNMGRIVGNQLPPPNVTDFTLTVRADGTRNFKWTTSNQPANVTTGGGYRLRFRDWFSTVGWSEWTSLHNGLLTQSPYETSNPIGGKYDFGIVAVNASGLESPTVAIISDALIGREPVSYDAAANLVFNSDWQLSNGLVGGESCLPGWEVGWSASAYGSAGRPASTGRNYPPWNPGRGGAWMLHSTTVVNTNGVGQPANYTADFAYFFQNSDKWFRVSPASPYEFSCLVNPHRCRVQMNVNWYDVNKQSIGQIAIDSYEPSGGSGAAGTGSDALGGWQAGFGGMQMLWGLATPPAGTAFAALVLIKYSTNYNQADSYVFFNRCMALPARPGVTRATATPWIESAYDQLHGGSLTDLSVDSRQIASEAATTYRTANNPYGVYLNYVGTEDYGTEACSIGYTAVVDCTVSVFALVQWVMVLHPSQNQIFYNNGPRIGLSSTMSVGANVFDGTAEGARSIVLPYYTSDTVHKNSLVMTRTYTMTAGQYAEFRVFGGGNYTAQEFYTSSAQLRLEIIKK